MKSMFKLKLIRGINMTKKIPPLASKQLEPLLTPIGDITPHPDNYKIHPPEQIKKLRASVKAFGVTSPLKANLEGVIVAGHGMYQLYLEDGYTDVPVIFEALDERMSKAYLVADNETARGGITEPDKLSELLHGVNDIPDFDIESVGFSSDDINSLLNTEIIDIIGNTNKDTEQNQYISDAKKNELLDINPTDYDLFVVSFSGGKDSTLLALWAVENLPLDKLIMVYWDSGWNWPEETKYVRYFAEKYKIKTILFGDLDNTRIRETIKQKGYPFYGNLWCQTLFKVHALNRIDEYLRSEYGDNIISLTGIRHTESKKREDYPEYYKSNGRPFWAPVRDFTDDDLINFLKSHNEKLCPLYNYANRTGCAWCCNHDVMVRHFLKFQHPNILCEINEAIADACAVESWKNSQTGLEETIKFFNKSRELKHEPIFKEVAYSYEDFDVIQISNDEHVIDLRGKVC